MPHTLILQDIRITLCGKPLITLDASIEPGTVLTVMGPSGSGKSTLLAYVGGFLDRAFTGTGRVLCGPHDLTASPPQERRAGLLFQDPLLFPHMSVARNLTFALPPGGSAAQRSASVEAALADINLAEAAERDPDTLSGGQKARVALARTLLSDPAFLLLDEPFSKLDAALRDQMRTLVFDRARAKQLPVMLVTHDEADAHAAGGPVFTVGADGCDAHR